MPHANLSFLVAATLLFAAAVEARAEKECCAEKKVGSIDYTLWPAGAFQGQIPDSCLNNCVYTITGTANPKFCFKTGYLPTACLSDHADSLPCVTDCSLLYKTFTEHLVSNETIAAHQDVLATNLCTCAECEERIRPLHVAIAQTLWPRYYQPHAEMMCSMNCSSAAQGNVDTTCASCAARVQASVGLFLSANETLAAIVDGYINSDLCETLGGHELCPEMVRDYVTLGLPLLHSLDTIEDYEQVCHAANPELCSEQHS